MEISAEQQTEPEFDVFARACPSRPVLEHATGRWGVLVLGGLHYGPLRFAALRRRVDGVSEKMLSQTLQTLERDGFVHREAGEGFPSRVEYSLTPLGRSTAELLIGLIEHLEASMPTISAAQLHYDAMRSAD